MIKHHGKTWGLCVCVCVCVYGSGSGSGSGSVAGSGSGSVSGFVSGSGSGSGSMSVSVQIEPRVRTHVVVFLSLDYLGGGSCLSPSEVTSPCGCSSPPPFVNCVDIIPLINLALSVQCVCVCFVDGINDLHIFT